jgi:hypothetical protein
MDDPSGERGIAPGGAHAPRSVGEPQAAPKHKNVEAR